MTKKMLGVLAVTILLLLSMAMLPTVAEEETSLGKGFTDILFSNDYRGFCLDNYKDGAYVDDKFTTTSASEATSNIDNKYFGLSDVINKAAKVERKNAIL